MTLTHLCIFIALLPAIIGLAAMGLHSLLGCTGGLGPGVYHCVYANDSIGNALKGLSWMVLGCVLSIPLALLLAFFGKLLGFGKGDGEAT